MGQTGPDDAERADPVRPAPEPVRDWERLQHTLTEYLERQPRLAVGALAVTGLYTDLPASIPVSGHRILTGRSVADIVTPTDRPALIDCWVAAHASGLSDIVVRLTNGIATRITLLDAHEPHGCYLLLMDVPDGAVPTPEAIATAPVVPPRYTVVYRDELARILHPDERLSRMLGVTAEQYVMVPGGQLVHPDDYARGVDLWTEILANPGAAQRWRGRYRCGDGSYLWLETTNHNELAEHGYVRVEMIDISAEMRMHESLQARERLLDRLTESFPLGMMQIDADGRVAVMNGQARRMLGRDVTGIADVITQVTPDDRSAFDAMVGPVMSEGTDGHVEVEMVDPRHHGQRFRRFEFRPLLEDGMVVAVVTSVTDITEVTLLNRELLTVATRDPLTGCHNRAAILSVLSRALVHAIPDNVGTGVVFIDLDGFKLINDRHGHACGDVVLETVAARLRRATREQDTIGRIGGDEFLAVLPGLASPQQALQIATRLAAAIPAPIRVGDIEVTVGQSTGVAWATNDAVTDEQLIAAADRAMYTAKRQGLHEPQLVVLDEPTDS